MLNFKEKGVAILYIMFVVSVMLAISLGISAILISQVRMLREVGYSVVAFYAADSGIERVLNSRAAPFNIPITSLPNGSTYRVIVTPAGPDCTALNFCIISIGTYQEIRRAIEISY